MLEINKLPPALYDTLGELNIPPGDILLFALSDMQSALVHGTTAFVLTSDTLHIINGTFSVTGGKKRPRVVFIKSDCFAYSLSDLAEISTEDMISTACVTAKYEGCVRRLAYTTNSSKKDVSLFCKYLKMYMEKGEIKADKEDFSRDGFCPKCGGRYPDSNRRVCPKCMNKTRLLSRLFGFMAEYRLYILLILISLIVVSALSIVHTYFSASFLYNRILSEGDALYGMVALVVFLVVSTSVLRAIVNGAAGIMTARISGRIIYKLKKTIFTSMGKLSMSFFTGRQTGGLMTQINNDANSIYWLFVDGAPYFIINCVQFISVFIIMLVMNPLLAVCTAAVLPAFAFIVTVIFKKMRALHFRKYSSSRSMNSALSDSLNGVRVVKAFAREDEESERFHTRSRRAASDNKAVVYFNNTAFPFANIVMYMSNIIVWAVGGWMIISNRGGMDYGTLVTFLYFVGMMTSPMFMFVDMSYWFSECTNAMQRLFEIADAEPEVREADEPVEKACFDGRVEFKNVEFSYTKNQKVIDGISFDIEPGRAIGIVGHTGAGKSTVANLLIRLYDVTAGEILIDGVNVKEYSVGDLRRNISIVSQETYLFMGTILDNIKYASPDASDEDVIKASKIAGAHDFIVKMTDGYETRIGFGYKDLSGGEKQRISIARAILKNPRILILDEATAAMDTQTERKIQHALNLLTKGRTTIMIAHRLSTLRDADKLIVIENGKMPEMGTHKELLMKKGVYHKLYRLQMEALKNIGVEE